MMEILFWLSLAAVVYVYVGYPLLAALWSRLVRRPVERGAWEPSVSVVIAAHNERGTIGAKIDNCRRLDYPADKLEVVVSLDGPTDGTDRVARASAAGAGCAVRVVGSARHEGKAAALNRAVAAARGEVLVFCDARQRVEPGAIRELVADLADPSVGAVTGELVLLDEDGHQATDGVGLYWRYEKALRSMESRIHSTVGATGALYAVRRELFRPIPDRAILDDVIVPMGAVLAGKRTIYEPRARVFDRVSPPELEFRRKVRTLAGNFQLLALCPELLVPGRNPVFVQLVSHKLGRLLAPHFLLLLLLSNLFLREGFFLLFLIAQCSWYLLAGAGALVRKTSAGGRRAGVPVPVLKGGHRQP